MDVEDEHPKWFIDEKVHPKQELTDTNWMHILMCVNKQESSGQGDMRIHIFPTDGDVAVATSP